MAALQEADRRDRSIIAFVINTGLESRRRPGLPGAADSPIRAFLTRLVTDAIGRGELAADTDLAAYVELLHVILWGLGFYAGFVASPADMDLITKQLKRVIAKGLLAGGAKDTHPDTPRSVGGPP
jgi:hypothetical protein